MRLVHFPLVQKLVEEKDGEGNVTNSYHTVTLPDHSNLFSSLYFDFPVNKVMAAYRGGKGIEAGIEDYPRDEVPYWVNDTEEWKLQNNVRYILTKKEFNLSFTATEFRAISNTADTDDTVYQFWNTAQVADFINLEDNDTIGGMAYLLSLGLLTQERHDEILAGIDEPLA